MGRFAAFLLIAGLASPALATSPPDPALPLPGVSADFNLTQAIGTGRTERSERVAYPTEQPRVPVNDALRPPQLLWNPTPASLVKVVPARVRYKLKF
jgi:hypothetical protein